MKIDDILAKIDEILNQKELQKDDKLKNICEILYKDVKHYNWVGFYFLKNDRLLLGPYVGEPTEHTNIGIGEGICGQAAALKKTFIVQDVSKENNYLSCSPKVKSEIVIPIIKDNKIIGELDIDSHYKDVFTDKDNDLLNNVVEKILENLF